MGKTIEFPKNYERFLLKGTELMNNGNMHEAVACFKKAYELKKERISNTLYTTALYETGEYQKAVEVAEDMINIYEDNEYRYLFYTTVLIKAKRFLQAEAAIKKRLDDKTSFYNQWLQLSQVLDTEKEKVKTEVKMKEQKLLKKMYAIGDLSLEEQLLLMEEAKKLPNHLRRNGCKAVLQNPFATEIAKTAALHYLNELNETEAVEFLWFDEMRNVFPNELLPLEEHPTINYVRNLLKKQTEKNPSLAELILSEAELHFMQLYPFFDEVITDPEKWTELYIMQYGEAGLDENIKKSEEEEKMKAWFNRLTRQIH